MIFQCPTLGACVEVGNYMSFSRASPPRASSLIRTHPFRRLASFLIRLLFRRHPFQHQICLWEHATELKCDTVLHDTRLVFISLYAL